MNTDALRTTSTNSAQETHGRVLGLELPLFRWVVLVLVGGLAAFAWLQSRQAVGWSAAFWLILKSPLVLVMIQPVLLCMETGISEPGIRAPRK